MPFPIEVDVLLEDLMPAYIETRKKDVIQLKTWLEEGNTKDFSALVHRIKGSAASYGLKRLSEICREIEGFVASGQTAAIKALLEEADHYIHNLVITYIEDAL